MCPTETRLEAQIMSVQFDASRGDYVVRWRQDGRHRKKRFKTEAEAVAFERTLAGAPSAPPPDDGMAAMEARLAELEAKVAAAENGTASAKGGVYAYRTAEGQRWYFKFRHADGSSSTKRGFKSRRAAVQARQALAEGVRRGEVKASRETFAEYWERFLAAKRPYVTRGTLVDYEIHGRRRLLPAFGSKRLTAIARSDVWAWLADMAELVEAGDVGHKTINNALTVFSVCMGMAAVDGLIATNPCQRVKHLPVAAREMDFLRLDEIPRYLDACPIYYRPLAGFLLGTGCRISEALAARWEDVDLADRSVRITRQRDRYTAGTTQTRGKRFRRVEIGPRLADELRRLRASRMAGGVDDAGWLFLCPRPVRGQYVGRVEPTPPNRRTAHEWHEATLQDAALRDMPLHSLRHTAAAAWLATGHPLMFVQRQLGHASITITEHHYGHFERTFLKDAAARTEAAIRTAHLR
jgi:integrase